MKVFFMTFLILAASVSQAAKFKSVSSLASQGLKTIEQQVVSDLIEIPNSYDMGFDISVVKKASLVRKSTEKDLNTMKQFAIAILGQPNYEDEGDIAYEIDKSQAYAMIDSALFAMQTNVGNLDADQVDEYKEKTENLAKKMQSIIAAKNNSGLKFFGGNHSYEDGTWGILMILDTTTNEILAVKLGAFGT